MVDSLMNLIGGADASASRAVRLPEAERDRETAEEFAATFGISPDVVPEVSDPANAMPDATLTRGAAVDAEGVLLPRATSIVSETALAALTTADGFMAQATDGNPAGMVAAPMAAAVSSTGEGVPNTNAATTLPTEMAMSPALDKNARRMMPDMAGLGMSDIPAERMVPVAASLRETQGAQPIVAAPRVSVDAMPTVNAAPAMPSTAPAADPSGAPSTAIPAPTLAAASAAPAALREIQVSQPIEVAVRAATPVEPVTVRPTAEPDATAPMAEADAPRAAAETARPLPAVAAVDDTVSAPNPRADQADPRRAIPRDSEAVLPRRDVDVAASDKSAPLVTEEISEPQLPSLDEHAEHHTERRVARAEREMEADLRASPTQNERVPPPETVVAGVTTTPVDAAIATSPDPIVGELGLGSSSTRLEAALAAPLVAPPPQAAPTPAQMLGAMEQVASAIAKGDEPTTIQLRLDPIELGKVDIDLSFDNGTVNVVVRAERDDVLDLMRRSAEDLMRMLRDTGLTMGSLDFGTRDGSPGEGTSGERGHTSARDRYAAEGAGSEINAPPPIRVAGGIDIRL